MVDLQRHQLCMASWGKCLARLGQFNINLLELSEICIDVKLHYSDEAARSERCMPLWTLL